MREIKVLEGNVVAPQGMKVGIIASRFNEIIVNKLLGGAVLTESIFSIAGIGKLMVDSIKLKNFPVVQGGVLFIAFVMCVVNLLVDVLYAFVDPKIRSQYVKGRARKAERKEG